MITLPTIKADFKPLVIQHKISSSTSSWERTVALPAQGRFVEESHYVTTDESFQGHKFPIAENENIDSHLTRSLNLYRQYNPSAKLTSLYPQGWNLVWTPEEGGAFGQGAIGNVQLTKLTPEMEMWFLTMMWAPGSRPAPSTQFLLSANNRHVVVVAGFETGPSDEKFFGGVTREVHAWLGTNGQSMIQIRFPKNQSLKFGPVQLLGDVGQFKVTAQSLNVRSLPDINAPVVGVLHKDQLVPEGPKQNDGTRVWMQIQLPEISGWASMKFLIPSE